MTPQQTFHDHIGELRRRLAWIILTIGVGSVGGYVLRTRVINFIQHPLGAPLFYTSPAGSFNFVLKTVGILGFLLALPLIVYQLVRFVEPALPKPLKRSLVLTVVLFSTILAAMGAAFAFFVMVPMSLHFFSTFSSATVKPIITAEEYLSYVLNLLLTFGLLFQIPLAMLFINKIRPMPPRKLLKYQRYVVVGAFALAVILPFTYDPISQFVMAVPIVFLFYFSILLIWIANRHVVYETPTPPQADSVLAEAAPVQSSRTLRLAPVPAGQSSLPSWQNHDGSLKSAAVLKTAVDVLKPGTISGRPLRPTGPEGMRVNRLNVIDLSNQT